MTRPSPRDHVHRLLRFPGCRARGRRHPSATPEEFLFRGLLQNLLSRMLTSDAYGWICASVLFGFSHITNYHFPNWRYVLLASIAALF